MGVNMPIEPFPYEQPQYPQLARAVGGQWRQAQRAYRRMRQDWFRGAGLSIPRKAVEELTAEQLRVVNEAISRFVAGFLGGNGMRTPITTVNADPSILKESIRTAWHVGRGRAYRVLGAAPDVRLSGLQEANLYERAFERLSDGSRARLADKLDDVKQAMIDGFRQGRNPLAIARDLRDDLAGIETGRVRMIVRTEMAIAAEAGITNVYVQEGIQEVEVIGNPNTDEACTMHIGKRYKVNDTTNLPIYHPNCVTGDSLVWGPSLARAFRRWHTGQIVDIRVAGGAVLSVTPNHPILTTKGWVAAGLLHEGSNVFCAIPGVGKKAGYDPHDADVPARIEDIPEAAFGSFGVTPARVPLSAVDFHGDGAGSEVSVVWSNSKLRDSHDAELREPVGHLSLVGTGAGRRLHADGAGDEFRFRGFHSSPSDVRGSGDGLLGFVRGPLVTGDLGFLETAPGHSAIDQELLQNRPADAEFFRQQVLALSGEVTVNRVLGITHRDFSGHVYNLQTAGGWYGANSIIIHNCFCSSVPIVT